MTTTFHTIEADGVNVFYREAGPADAPVVLLLHGFPSSSHMYRNLIPLLATKYKVIAPDLPGFGFTSVPAGRNYVYTFDNLTATLDALVQKLKLEKYALYAFDYGAPTGFRLAAAHPERVTAVISQNGNAYLEGLGEAWGPTRQFWAEPTEENRATMRNFLSLEATKWQYQQGVAYPDSVAPETYHLDAALLDRPGNRDIQLDLILDYANNLTQYPAFQKFFRDTKLPTLVIWGKNDPFFIPPGAEAFKRDNPNAEVIFLDTGHFAVETHGAEIAAEMHKLLERALA
ncbi:alpha/beta hydrolase [Duganella sp. sic0402]|uniref:alpha/beta fold hydrolase n=1 Tax=Duganella sp. sic0402 TaxID=2854786 RepID=UPI001C442A1F|nr:alpha/beta hydrolase [Duganella sp. sic0402]MBV7534155.1 alpha/beta hydrolase [Duganella sp. sic0402]